MRNLKIAWGVALASTLLAVGESCLAPSKMVTHRSTHSGISPHEGVARSTVSPSNFSQPIPLHFTQAVRSEGFLASLLMPALQGWLGADHPEPSDWNQVLPPVMVSHTPLGAANHTQPTTAELRQSFWKRCEKSLDLPSSAAKSVNQAPQSEMGQFGMQATQGMFQVWVKGCLVAEFPSQAEAQQNSEALTQVLKNPQVDLSQLKLTILNGQPVAQLGDQTLFTVTADLAKRLDQNPELLAIAWVNQLRQALGHNSLNLSQAQQQMYELQPGETVLQGDASWYGPYFHGRITATGEVFNQYDLTAAHRDLPFDTYLHITNLKNGRQVVVRINDRGPYFEEEARIIDLSYRAATVLGSDEKGIAPIKAVILKSKPGSQMTTEQRIATTVKMSIDP
ncbi:MAG: septal ring lytic transglycosylase RlpA family protein [Synechococcales bacterium]|nr:septal ring lytic transglycosylase RlpA family protein [Synechococcales bacterium]